MTARAEELLAAGAAALRAGDGRAARTAFEQAAAIAPSGTALEGLARASYLDMEFLQAIETWEQAYAMYRAAGDQLGAVRVARTLGGMHGTIVGDWAVGSGWLARAQTLVDPDVESAETGWVALNLGMFEPDRGRKEASFRQALAVGRRLGDTALEVSALAYLGASCVHDDRYEEGMLLLDEALAGVAGNDVDDFCVLEEVFCQLFSACEHSHDVARADQWIRVGEAIAERRRLPAVSAFCRTHYGGVLTAAGRWKEADATLTEAVRLWSLGQRSSLRAGALVRLADLRVRQGRFEEAEQLLEGIDADTFHEAARSVAAIRLARGETALAADVLERALAELDPSNTASAPLMALLVDVHLTAGDGRSAADVADQLLDCASRHPANHYLRASAALARGRVALHTGDGDPQVCLREALAGFARAQLPMEVAHSRLQLASALVADRPEVAMAEARAALEAFERLQAARDVDAANALLRSLGVRPTTARQTDGVLTRREEEVLDLLGHGLSNPQIAERLFISRKTVEHHVGNVLAKLGLRSRAEAGAYASRRPGKPAAD